MNEFTLDIQVGNSAMASASDIAQSLRNVADRIDAGDFHPGHTRSILDINGNRVGSYRLPTEVAR